MENDSSNREINESKPSIKTKSSVRDRINTYEALNKESKTSFTKTPNKVNMKKRFGSELLRKKNEEINSLKQSNQLLKESLQNRSLTVGGNYVVNQHINQQVVTQQTVVNQTIGKQSANPTPNSTANPTSKPSTKEDLSVSVSNMVSDIPSVNIIQTNNTTLTNTQKDVVNTKHFENKLQKKIDEVLSDRNHTSTKLGEIGENLVVDVIGEVSKTYNLGLAVKRISVDAKHSGDILVLDKQYGLLFNVEVKNKQEITKEDLTKFESDLENIKRQYKKYVVVGLFISLYTNSINSTLKSLTITYEKTYITRNCFTVEFLRMYIENIRQQTKINTQITISDSDKKILEDIKSNFDEVKFLIDQCAEMETHIESLKKNVDKIQGKIKNKFNSMQGVLSNVDPKSVELDLLKKKLVEYCRSNNWSTSKVKVQDARNIMGIHATTVFDGRLTRERVIEIAREYESMYNY